jgi:hypothetical protein
MPIQNFHPIRSHGVTGIRNLYPGSSREWKSLDLSHSRAFCNLASILYLMKMAMWGASKNIYYFEYKYRNPIPEFPVQCYVFPYAIAVSHQPSMDILPMSQPLSSFVIIFVVISWTRSRAFPATMGWQWIRLCDLNIIRSSSKAFSSGRLTISWCFWEISTHFLCKIFEWIV